MIPKTKTLLHQSMKLKVKFIKKSYNCKPKYKNYFIKNKRILPKKRLKLRA